MRNAKNMGMLYACKGVHALFTGQREREGERERLSLRSNIILAHYFSGISGNTVILYYKAILPW